MSPRAACRLERLGYHDIYDYEPGIADWKAAGLPVDGQAAAVPRVADATRPDVPTSTPDELLGDIHSRTFESGWEECIVIDCQRIVVGRLRNKDWGTNRSHPAEAVMESGLTTVRSDGLLQPLVERMVAHGTTMIIVTTPQGQLLGALRRSDAQRLLTGESPEQIWRDCAGCPGQWNVVPTAK